jgi:hypothetical protein
MELVTATILLDIAMLALTGYVYYKFYQIERIVEKNEGSPRRSKTCSEFSL